MNSITTGEWTAENVASLGRCGQIADAHNAALAAAYERGKLEGVFASPDEGEIGYVRKLELQLAAEQETRLAQEHGYESEIRELREQLAAERKTTENLRIEAKQNWKLIDQLREQQ